VQQENHITSNMCNDVLRQQQHEQGTPYVFIEPNGIHESFAEQQRVSSLGSSPLDTTLKRPNLRQYTRTSNVDATRSISSTLRDQSLQADVPAMVPSLLSLEKLKEHSMPAPGSENRKLDVPALAQKEMAEPHQTQLEGSQGSPVEVSRDPLRSTLSRFRLDDDRDQTVTAQNRTPEPQRRSLGSLGRGSTPPRLRQQDVLGWAPSRPSRLNTQQQDSVVKVDSPSLDQEKQIGSRNVRPADDTVSTDAKLAGDPDTAGNDLLALHMDSQRLWNELLRERNIPSAALDYTRQSDGLKPTEAVEGVPSKAEWEAMRADHRQLHELVQRQREQLEELVERRKVETVDTEELQRVRGELQSHKRQINALLNRNGEQKLQVVGGSLRTPTLITRVIRPAPQTSGWLNVSVSLSSTPPVPYATRK